MMGTVFQYGQAPQNNNQTALPGPEVASLSADSMIATIRGPVAVAELMTGDMALTRDGGFRPIAFVGKLETAEPMIRIEASTLTGVLPLNAMRLGLGTRLLINSCDRPSDEASLSSGDTLAAIKELHAVASYVVVLCRPADILCSGVWIRCPFPSEHGIRGLAARLAPQERARLFHCLPVTPIFDSRKKGRRAGSGNAPLPRLVSG